METELTDILLQCVYALISLVLFFVMRVINHSVKNEKVKGALFRLSEAVVEVVKRLSQQIAEDYKRANKDGVLTDDEKAYIKARAMTLVKEYIGPKGVAELLKILGLDSKGFESVVSTKIESAIYLLKKN